MLTENSHMMCPHAGQVNVPTKGYGVPLTVDDAMTVSGCPFPRPCTRVKWVLPAAKGSTLNRASIGLCVTRHEAPNGAVIVVRE